MRAAGRQTQRQTGRQEYRQASRNANRREGIHTDGQECRRVGRQAGRQTHTQTDRQTDRKTDKQADLETGRQAERQTNRQRTQFKKFVRNSKLSPGGRGGGWVLQGKGGWQLNLFFISCVQGPLTSLCEKIRSKFEEIKKLLTRTPVSPKRSIASDFVTAT
jgi:hypothetical protein